jgi:O-antigen ligase
MRIPQFIRDLLPLCGILGISLIYLQKVITYGYERELTGGMIKFAGLAYADWGVLCILGSGALLYREMKPLLRRPLVIAVLLLTGMAVIIGFPQALSRTMIVNDVRITLSFICGLIFAFSLRHSRIWHWHLLLLLLCLVVLMLKAYRDATFGESFVAGLSGGARIATINSVAALSSASLVLVALLITLGSLRSRWILPNAFGLYMPVFYMAVVSSGTRSSVIYVVAALGCAMFVRAYGHRERGLDPWPSLVRLAGLGAIAGVFSGLFVYRYRSFLYEQALLFLSRFKGEGMAADSSSLRLLEVQALFNDMNPFAWVVGRGAGGVFPSPIYEGGLAPTLHVGIFTFLLKFGLPVFLVVVGILYCYLPYRFCKAIALPRNETKKRRESIMLVFPCMLPMIGGLSLSGGYGTGSMLWWGLLYGCYVCLERDGLAPYLSGGRSGMSGLRQRSGPHG